MLTVLGENDQQQSEELEGKRGGTMFNCKRGKMKNDNKTVKDFECFLVYICAVKFVCVTCALCTVYTFCWMLRQSMKPTEASRPPPHLAKQAGIQTHQRGSWSREGQKQSQERWWTELFSVLCWNNAHQVSALIKATQSSEFTCKLFFQSQFASDNCSQISDYSFDVEIVPGIAQLKYLKMWLSSKKKINECHNHHIGNNHFGNFSAVFKCSKKNTELWFIKQECLCIFHMLWNECGRWKFDVLCCVLWQVPVVDEAAGIANRSFGKALILKIYVPCKKTGDWFRIFIYLFLANKVDCQALISNKDILLSPKHSAKCGAFIYSLSRSLRQCCLLNVNLNLDTWAIICIALEPLAGCQLNFFWK